MNSEQNLLSSPWLYGIGVGLAVLIIWVFLQGWVQKAKIFLNKRTGKIVIILRKIVMLLRGQIGRVNKEVPDFIATEQQANDQGCYIKRLDVQMNLRIRSLSFTVESEDDFWRAGFKVFSPNGNFQPLADVKSGMLFHLVYPHPQKNKIEALTLTSKERIPRYIERKNRYRIEMYVSPNNFMQCLVNGEKCFQKRIDPENLENAYLGAWADYKTGMNKVIGMLAEVKEFKVNFSDIRYTVTNF